MKHSLLFLAYAISLCLICVNISPSSRLIVALPSSQIICSHFGQSIQDNLQEPASGNSISPYEIKRYIDEHQRDEHISLEPYWHQLGIKTEELEKYGKYKAEVFALDLDHKEGPEVMLRLYDNSGWSNGAVRYLLFKPSKSDQRTKWRLLGYVYLDDLRYSLPEHRVVSSGESHWLVLTVLVGSGSGYGLYHDQWYEITAGGLKEVFECPAKKFVSWGDPYPILEAESKIISTPTETGTTKVVIEFSASYVLYNDGREDQKTKLWSKKQRAVFVRQIESEEFKFDEQSSELSQVEFNAVYEGEGPSDIEILRYNFASLENIALGKDEKLKGWLRSYLIKCKETDEKEKLLKSLSL